MKKIFLKCRISMFSLLDIKKRNRRSHGKRRNGNFKHKHKTVQLRAKIFMGRDFCHNYLHTSGWYKRLLSVNAYLNLRLYHSMCLKDVHSTSFKKFKSSILKCHIKSCRIRTIGMTTMKSVYFDVKRLLQDNEIHFPCEIHVGVFHNNTSGDCKHHQKKAIDLRWRLNSWTWKGQSKWESVEVLIQSILHVNNFLA